MKRISKYKIRLLDIQLYVFCGNYQQQNQRRGAAGAFEICFVSEEGKPPPPRCASHCSHFVLSHGIKTASKRFKELFSSPPPETTTESTTEATEQTSRD